MPLDFLRRRRKSEAATASTAQSMATREGTVDFEASVVRVLLDGTKRQMDVVGFTPDWQPR